MPPVRFQLPRMSKSSPGASARSTTSPVSDPFDVSWQERVLVLGAVAALLTTFFVLGVIYAPTQTSELAGLIPMALFAVGKFLPLWGISGKSSLGPYELGAVIWALDTTSCIVIVYALEAFYKIRPLKRWLERVQSNAALVLSAYPGIRKAAVTGIVIFVLFPVTGTGALAAAMIGVLLGMNRFVLIGAVSLGGCLGGFLMAFLAVHFGEALSNIQALQDNPTNKYLVLAGVVTLLAIGVYFLNRKYQRVLASARAQNDRGEQALQ